ncbi:MAG: LysR family transcriptional regulator [Wenzhouxiangellaceae bacterium]
MRTFVQVVDSGSLTQAADTLNLAKSVVSRRLNELERWLDVQLIIRTTRSLSLTPNGQAYYEQCQRLLGDLAEVENTLRRQDTALHGPLRIALPLTFGVHHLGGVLVDFLRQHPGIELDVDYNDRHIDLISEGIDLCLRIGRLEDSSLIARSLAPVNHIICASPDYIEQHGALRCPDDLRHHRLIHYSNLRDNRWRYTLSDGSRGSVNVRPAQRANNGDFIRDLTIAGQGISLLPTFVMHQALRQGQLLPLLTQYRWVGLRIYLVYPPTRHLSQRVRALVDFLVGTFADTPPWDQDLPLRLHH